MESLDNEMLALKKRPGLVSLIYTLFIIYPNIAWFACDLEYFVPVEEHLNYVLFSLFRSCYFYGLIWLLFHYNMSRLLTPSFLKRLGWNILFTLGGFLVYELITRLVLPHNYDRLISILSFQYIIVCILSALNGHIHVLYESQRQKDKEIEDLRVENLQSRYNALTNQINPHFFFNSLNGISSLVRRKEVDRTLDYVSQLSDIFRYILQSGKKELVTLGEELDFIEAFRHVMEVRFANKLSFAIRVPGDKRYLRIPVLSLLPLVENVTVHNMIDSEHKMEISIYLDDQLNLVVSNPIYPKLSPPDTNGTGLKNLENRFWLLRNKKIRIENDGQVFSVYLPLN